MRIFAGAASSRKSNASWPWRDAISVRTTRAERRALLELVVRLLDDREIGEREERVGVGAEHGPDDAALHEIAQMILAQRAVAREQIAHRVVLPLQRLGRRHADQPAELVLGEDPDLRTRLRVQLLGPFQLVALLPACAVGRRPESFGADHEHRRLRVDVVGRRAAEARRRARARPCGRASSVFR